LKPYGIKYEPRTTIKGYVLADFIVEYILRPPTQCNLLDGWVLNVDGASNNKSFRIRIVFTTPEESIIKQSFTLGFSATNNEVEYEAIITDLKMAATLRVTRLEVRRDSLLVV